jgi:hypothetical protein
VQSNITDHENGKLKGPHGSIQGYKGIAVADSANQVIVAVEAFGSGCESKQVYGDGGKSCRADARAEGERQAP